MTCRVLPVRHLNPKRNSDADVGCALSTEKSLTMILTHQIESLVCHFLTIKLEQARHSLRMQVNIMKGDKAAEDWEYEENAADDDDDMGEQEDVNNRDASPSPRRSAPTCMPQLLHMHTLHVLRSTYSTCDLVGASLDR